MGFSTSVARDPGHWCFWSPWNSVSPSGTLFTLFPQPTFLLFIWRTCSGCEGNPSSLCNPATQGISKGLISALRAVVLCAVLKVITEPAGQREPWTSLHPPIHPDDLERKQLALPSGDPPHCPGPGLGFALFFSLCWWSSVFHPSMRAAALRSQPVYCGLFRDDILETLVFGSQNLWELGSHGSCEALLGSRPPGCTTHCLVN